jgi:hypothetical protein
MGHPSIERPAYSNRRPGRPGHAPNGAGTGASGGPSNGFAGPKGKPRGKNGYAGPGVPGPDGFKPAKIDPLVTALGAFAEAPRGPRPQRPRFVKPAHAGAGPRRRREG